MVSNFLNHGASECRFLEPSWQIKKVLNISWINHHLNSDPLTIENLDENLGLQIETFQIMI